jgi:hypothetical protein
VTGDGSQQGGPGSPLGGGDPAADVVEQGGRQFPSLNWRPSRGAAILLAVGLVTGLTAGYAAGYRQAPRNTSPPTASPGSASSVPTPSLATGIALPYAGGPALTQATGTCSSQAGRELQLGVQVTNGSAAQIELGLVHAVLPLGGLRAISQQWAPCGALGVGQVPAALGPGNSTWFSLTFQVLVKCPGPLPVQFTVDYTTAGEPAAINLPGFPDLSQVPYTGCAEARP